MKKKIAITIILMFGLVVMLVVIKYTKNSKAYGDNNRNRINDDADVIKFYDYYDYDINNSDNFIIEAEANTSNCDFLNKVHYSSSVKYKTEYYNGDVLLLHGAAYSSDTWVSLNTMKILETQGFRAVAIDLPGFGKTPPLEAISPVHFINCVINGFELKRPFLVSPSMSGKYSIPYVMKHPDRLAGYVPIAPIGTSEVSIKEWEKLNISTLILYGSTDKMGRTVSNNILQLIPLSTVREIRDAGHACYIDNSREFHIQLIKFIIKHKII